MTDTEQKEYDAAWDELNSAKPAADEAADAEGSGQAAQTLQDEAAPEPPDSVPETNPQDDIWADAPDHLRSAFLDEKSRADRLEHQRKSDEGRVSRFQRERDEALKQLGAVAKVAGHEDPEAYLASDEFARVRAEYGDDLNPVFKALETLAARDKQNERQLSDLSKARSDSIHDANVDWLNQQAPGWVSLLDRDDFGPWLEAQPQGVRDMIERNSRGLVDPAEVKVVRDLFMTHVGSQQAAGSPASHSRNHRRREVQLDGARSTSSRAPILTGPDRDDYDAGWAAAEADRLRAQARR